MKKMRISREGEGMFVYRGYLDNDRDEIVDESQPLVVTSAGNIRPRSAERWFTIRPEGRRDYQLIYVADGRIHFRFAEGERVLEKGHMVLFRPGEMQHYELFIGDRPEFFWVHFTGSEVETLLAECGLPADRRVYWMGTSSDYRSTFYQMIKEMQTKHSHYEELLRSCLRQILLLMHRHLEQADDPPAAYNGEIIQAIGWIGRHWQEKISFEEYAVRNRLTPYWFREKFKQYTGCTPLQYLINLRIHNAINLMENTDLNVSQVAYAVGYENVSYFRRLFYSHTGLTPGQYMRQKGKKQTGE